MNDNQKYHHALLTQQYGARTAQEIAETNVLHDRMLAALGDQKRNGLAVYATLDVLAYLIVNEVGYHDQCGTLGGVEFFVDLLRESVARARWSARHAVDVNHADSRRRPRRMGNGSPKVSDK
jgi:hypothetical protein